MRLAKNWDLALALDAMEAMFDKRADTFCLVTSDSDSAYLCRKLRKCGATVCMVGETKTPDALRYTSDQFFIWNRLNEVDEANFTMSESPSPKRRTSDAPELNKAKSKTPIPKKRPMFLVDAVDLLASDTAEGKVGLGQLGQYLKRTDPAFSPLVYGHSGLLDMVKTYDLLTVWMEAGGNWPVKLSPVKPVESQS